MRHLFILNPIAGELKNKVEELQKRITGIMEKEEKDFEIYVTTGHMDAAEKVKREAIRGDELCVYACGGDGTLSECAHGAAGFKNASVTHYPCGTGNDFVKTFSGDEELFRDIEALVNGTSVPFDIMDVNGRKCLNISSVGIDARVGFDVHKYSGLPLVNGKMAYIISMVVNLFKGINREFSIICDGEQFEGTFALACACNGRYYGGGFNPTKTAMPDDGLLDILIVKGVSLFKIPVLLGKYAKGEYYKLAKYIDFRQARKLHIEAEEKFGVNVDGEELYTNSADIKLIPDGVNFILPRGSRFLKEKIERMSENRIEIKI